MQTVYMNSTVERKNTTDDWEEWLKDTLQLLRTWVKFKFDKRILM